MSKVCNKCNFEKSLDNFSKGNSTDGLKYTCKDCDKKAGKIRTDRIKNQEKINVDVIICFKCKKEKDAESFDRNKCSSNGYQSSCKVCRKTHRAENKNYQIIINREWRKNNKEYKAKKDKEYRINNKEKINIVKREYEKNKRKTNPLYKLSCNIRRNIKYIFNNSDFNIKNNTLDILDCSMKEFKSHIESQFENWMSWENYGDVCGDSPGYNCSWDLDHIIPISYAKAEEQLYLLNHWSNFQPLCSRKNRWDKKNSITALSNIVLNITIIKNKNGKRSRSKKGTNT